MYAKTLAHSLFVASLVIFTAHRASAQATPPQKAPGQGAPSWLGLPPATAPAGAADNAATHYRQAFALLDAAATREIRAAADVDGPPNDAAVAVVKKYDAVSQLLRKGAAAPKCDWGLDRGRGPELVMPHLDAARTASQLTGLRVRVEARDKKPADAYEDAAALLVLGRRVGSDPIAICKMVEGGVVLSAVGAAAEALPQAPPDVLTKFDQRLAALPPSQPPADVIRGEAASTVAWLRAREKADPQAVFGPAGTLAAMGATRGPDNPLTAATFQRWADPAARAADVAGLQSAADAAGAVFTAPAAQVPQAAEAWKAKRAAAGPLADLFLPIGVDNFRRYTDMVDVQLAMLRTAVGVRLRGPDAAKTSRDPAGGGPFEYRATPAGFELKSKMEFKGKPVTLTAGPEQP